MIKVYIWPVEGDVTFPYRWATEEPLPHDDSPNKPGRAYTVQHAYDEAMTFANGPFYPLFDQVAPRFAPPPKPRKWRVNFEASAAIGIEVEVDAISEEDAEHEANKLIARGLDLHAFVEGLISPCAHAVRGYALTSGQPITHAVVSIDENGFEISDTFEPAAIGGPSA
jgi:hypothetical protein